MFELSHWEDFQIKRLLFIQVGDRTKLVEEFGKRVWIFNARVTVQTAVILCGILDFLNDENFYSEQASYQTITEHHLERSLKLVKQ